VVKYNVAVGDVAGKGVPAALLMAVSIASFRAIVAQDLTPQELLTQMDMAVANYTRSTQQNCALVCVQLEIVKSNQVDIPTRHILRVANAGCVMPLIKRVDGSVSWVEVGGMPLGTGLGSKLGYVEMTLEVRKGDLVILTSDGVLEAHNSHKEMFSFDGLEQAIVEGPQGSAKAMLEHLKVAVEKFVGKEEAHDDMTIVVVQI
jgi:sigma-B regulation protein RsbU (phosphoserine phosphatase)